jgi:hypothetical protein
MATPKASFVYFANWNIYADGSDPETCNFSEENHRLLTKSQLRNEDDIIYREVHR